MREVAFDEFMTLTVGILVFFAGVHLNRRIEILRRYNIPEPVTGGLLAAVTLFGVYLATGTPLSFAMETRGLLLVYFFSTIGLNARISDLLRGGRPLLTLLGLTIGFVVIQNAVGYVGAGIVGLPTEIGILAGSASLIGGHGTAIAWAPEVEALGISNALEIGVASATLGLVAASLIGGPIARFLIGKHRLEAAKGQEPVVGLPYSVESQPIIDHLSLMAALLTIHVTIVLGYCLNTALAHLGLKLPLFVACLLMGIVLSNTVPVVFKGLRWPARSAALAVISDLSLGLFLAMSLMAMQLYDLADLAAPLFLLLGFQLTTAVVFILFVVFPLMGRNYQAAVLSAGFGGFALGATPTAIANMTGVTKTHGPAPNAMIMLPLVSAFFVDVANSVILRFALLH